MPCPIRVYGRRGVTAQRSMHHARALLRALQKEPPHVGRAGGGAVRETPSVKSMQGTTLTSSVRDSDCSFQKVRWTSAACPLPHAAPSCPSTHAASFSSAASPSVSGKPGGPGGSTDDAATVASSEDKLEAKPIQPPFTGDAKRGTGPRKIMSGVGQGERRATRAAKSTAGTSGREGPSVDRGKGQAST